MPSQKTFKQRVRTRMAKTGESYTAARHQLIDKARPPEATYSTDEVAVPPADPGIAPSTSDGAIRRATGRPHAEWVTILDGWGATDRTHTEIARWLHEEQGVGAWWSQSITVDYERARGMRAQHQMTSGFSIGVTRTLARNADDLLLEFVEADRRQAWLPNAPMTPRPTRSALSARFDWSDPVSRVVVTISPRGPGRATVSVSHERLPDAEAAAELKGSWRAWLEALRTRVEMG